MAPLSRAFRILIVVVPMLCAAPASAQIASTKPYTSLFLVRDASGVEIPGGTRTPPLIAARLSDAANAAVPLERPVEGTPRGVQPALYAGLTALQALDVHSTLRAVDAGNYETNPLVRWGMDHPVALISMKAAASAMTVYVAERIRAHHPKHATVFMAAVNAAYALVVVHNYNVPVR
jgi:hypothetical protein